MAKVEYFFINTLVRIDVSQGINLTLVEVFVNLLRVLFIPLHEVPEAFLGSLEFFFRFSFTHFAVEIDLPEFLVELGEIVRIEVLHRDPVFDDSFPGGFHSWLIIIVPVSGAPSSLGLGGCVLLRFVLVGFVGIDTVEEILPNSWYLGHTRFQTLFVRVLLVGLHFRPSES